MAPNVEPWILRNTSKLKDLGQLEKDYVWNTSGPVEYVKQNETHGLIIIWQDEQSK